MLLKNLLILSLAILAAACDSEIAVMLDAKNKAVAVESLDLLAANEGDSVGVSGRDLNPNIEVYVNDQPAAFSLVDDATRGTFTMPSGLGNGQLTVVFKLKNKVIAKFPMMTGESAASMSIQAISAENVCDTFIFKNASGILEKGKRTCAETLADCSQDGQINCLATEEFPVVLTSDLAPKITFGETLVGISSSAAEVCVDAIQRPRALLTGEPTGTSNALALNVTVSGTDVIEYKYKIRQTTDAACSIETGYSLALPIALPITDGISSLADGTFELCVIGGDSAGNWQLKSVATAASWIKRTAPPVATILGEPTGSSNALVLNVTVAGSDVTHYKHKLRVASDPACSVGVGYSAATGIGASITDDLSAFADEQVTLCVIGGDAAGNWQTESSASTVSWTKDVIAPSALLSGEPTGTNNATVLSVTVAGTEVSHYKYKIREPSDLACSNPTNYSAEVAVSTLISSSVSALADGVLELCVIGRDAAGNWQTHASAATASWTKDTTLPLATIAGQPTGTNNAASLNVSVAGTDVVAYKYKIREMADTPCSNAAGYSAAIAVATPITDSISGLADGPLQLCVIGRDTVGNWQLEGTATVVSWTKDATAPTATITSAPSGINANTVLDITIAGSGVTEYKYKLRVPADAACSVVTGYSAAVPVATHITDSIAALADGAIELCVIGNDALNNWQLMASASTASWTKDATAPVVTLSGQPTGTNNATTLNVTVSGTGVSHYKYKVRETADVACSNAAGYSAEVTVGTLITASVSALADGVLQLCVIGRDALGNWQTEATATAASWTKDTTPPTATLSGEPTGTNNVTTSNVTVAGTDVIEYKYKIRVPANAACSDSTGYSAAIAVATPITDSVSGLTDGTIELCVIGKDTVGNWQLTSSATTVSWIKDTSAPTATITGAPTGSSNALSLNATVAGTDITEYKYKIRVPADATCSVATGYSAAIAVATPITDDLSLLADGTITICVIGKNSLGNWQTEASATTASWTKDVVAPTAALSGEPIGTNNVATLNVNVSGTDVSHYKFKVRVPADLACSNAAGYSTEAPVGTPITSDVSTLADGVLELCIIGRDAAGNWQTEASAANASWTKDTTRPLATLSGEPTGTNNAVTLNITVTGTDVIEYKYKIRVPANAACSNSTGYSAAIAVATPITDSISGLTDGTIELCVIGKDTVGNWQLEGTATVVSWTKDATAPTATITSAPTGINATTVLDITVAGSGVTEYKYKLRVPADAACSVVTGYSAAVPVATHITDSIAALADGAIELCVIGNDASNNWQLMASASTVSWTKDVTAPVAAISGQPTGTNNASILNVTVSGAGVSHYKYKVRAPADVACSDAAGYSAEVAVATLITSSLSALADGVLELCVVGRDALGNWQTEANATAASWTKDVTAPIATLAGEPTGTNNITTLNVTVAGTGVTEYKYKIREATDAACSNIAGYSASISVATLISDDLSGLADGNLELCIIGKDSVGNWQLEASATTASWIKDVTAPTATIANAPTATNAATTLDVTIAGTDVTHYKYKLRVPADSACSVASGYSSAIAVGTHITDGIAALADGTISLCVIGKDSSGNWQTEATASTASWIKDTTAPAATLSGVPSGTNNTTSLNVTIAGTGVSHYKYKAREPGDLACSNATNYSAEVAVSTLISSSVSGLADGVLELCVIGKDAAGNWQTEATATAASWSKDTTPPTATLSDEPAGTNNVTTLNVTIAGTDVAAYKYKVRETAAAACSNPADYSAAVAVATPISSSIASLADGTLELCVIGQDTVGNWQLEASATTVSWIKDTSAPTATIAGAPTGSSNALSLNATIVGTDITHYKYKVRVAADPACSVATGYSAEIAVTTPINDDISALADGAVTICVIGKNSLGNWQTEATATAASWTKDVTPPVATLSGQPIGTNNFTALSVTVAGTSVSHYKFKVRVPADAACSNVAGYSAEVAVGTPITASLSALADGVLELCVIGRDAAGNWQTEATATVASWTKDATAPIATIAGEPTGTNNITTLNITVAGTDVTEYKYKIRVPADTACSISTGYSAAISVATPITDDILSLADGAVQLCVIGKDAMGNWQLEGTATIASWTKDVTAPTATIANAPTGANAATTLDVTIAGTDVTHYKYKLRVPADAACSVASGYSSAIAVGTHITNSIAALADGTISLCVIGKDSSGNWQTEATASVVSWTKDTTAPIATLSGAPSGTNNATTLSVTVAGTNVSHYKYKVRVPADASCADAGGYSAEAAVATLITSSISALADGVLELCVIGRDAAGNWQTEATATTAGWTKDTTLPAATLTGEPSGTNNGLTLNVTVAGTDVVQYKYKIRQTADTACSDSSGYSAAILVATHITDSITGLPDGALQLCVIGRDTAGNWQLEGTATIASWTKDTTAPTATLVNAPTGTNNATTLDVAIDGTDVTHYKYKIRVPADAACSVTTGYSASIAVATHITDSIAFPAYTDGSITLCVIGKDSSGNWQTEATASTASWTKDATAPVATLSGAPTGTNNTTTLSVTVAGTGVSHYKYKVRETADLACSNAGGYSAEVTVGTLITASVSALADGVLQLCVIGRDSSGNWQTEATATTASWTKDTTPPVATLSGEPSGTNNVVTLNVTVAGSDVVQYKYKIRETADTACSNSTGYSAAIAVATHITSSLSALADGALQLCVIGKDSVGNWQLEGTSTIVSWTKDTIAPTATVSNVPSGLSATTTLDVTIAGTGVSHYKYKIRATADTACSVVTGYSAEVVVATHITSDISSMADGTIELCVIGRDASGNYQALASAAAASWTKSTVGPTATLSGAPTGSSATINLNVTVAGTNVTHYKYKIRSSADTACSNATGYSSEIAVATHITDNISGKPEGTIEICVVARGTTNIYQTYASASSTSWLKDVSAPVIPNSISVKPRENAIRVTWVASGSVDDDLAGYILLRRATTAISDAPVKGSSYVAGNTIGSSAVVYVGTGLSFTDTNVSLGTEYFYKVFALDHNPTYSAGIASSARPVAYEPPSVDDLLLWTDASYNISVLDGSSAMVTADGTAVGSIKNISSANLSFSQGTAGLRPLYKTSAIYGHVALRHSNTQRLGSATSSIPSGNQPHSLVYIGSFSDTVTSGAIHIGSTSPDSMIKLLADSGQIIYSFGSNDLKYTAPTTTTAKVYLGTYNGVNGTSTNRKLYINGAAQSVAASTGTLTNTLNLPATVQVTMGSDSAATQYLSGDAGEYLLYDHDLSPSEIIDLSKYAWNKWSIPQIDVTVSSLLPSITLTWTDGIASASYLVVRRAGSAPTFAPVNGNTYTVGAQGADNIVHASATKTYVHSTPTEGTTYYYAIYGNDGNNNYTPVVSTQATALVTPALTATPGNAQNTLSWPAVPEASGYLLVRKTAAGGAPTFVPTNGSTYSASVQGSDTIRYVGTGTSFNDTGLTNGSTYYYKLYAYDSARNYATAKSNSATPAVPIEVCGGAGDLCYDDAAAIAVAVATTPTGKSIEYVISSGAFYVWKEVSGNRVLKADGSDNWAKKLNTNGRGFTATDFNSYTSIVGRVCPPNVYIDDSNKFTTGNCLYYSSESPQALNANGTDGINGLKYWTETWYVGNIQVCSTKGMRLPTIFETSTTNTNGGGDYPTADGSPTFAQSNGIPSNGGKTWTSTPYVVTGYTAFPEYWLWNGTSAIDDNYDDTFKVRCVLP